MASVKYPLLRQKRRDAIVAFRQGKPMTAEQFLGDVAALATRLPARRHVVNLCSDCYEFAVGLAAALSRGQISLLPPNGTPAMLQELATDFADLYCLTDAGATGGPIPSTAYPDDLADHPAEPQFLAFPATQPALVLFTSGSTGRPKPHAKSWGTLVRSARAAGARLGIDALPNATVIGTVPHHHSYGLESRLLLAQQHGLAIEAARPFYPSDICAALDAAPRPRILVSTPIHLRTLLREVGALPIVDLVISATASLAPQLAVEAEERFGGRLCEIYGCSEAGQLATRSTAHEEEWQCLDGVVLRQDAQGTWASGAPVAAESLLQDVIELRGADRFLLHDRKADLVNIAGKRTSLAYLNHQLNATRGVKDGIFIMPAEQEGEQVTRLMALVVAPGVAAEDILGALRQKIDAAFLPRPLLLVESLPRNMLGKLPREALLRLVAQSAST